jgi:pentatricopeptide repeat protein
MACFQLVPQQFCQSVFSFILQTEEASNVFEHISTLGVKPNATTYSLLADAHLANKDPKAALAVIDKMVSLNYHSKMYFCTGTFL